MSIKLKLAVSTLCGVMLGMLVYSIYDDAGAGICAGIIIGLISYLMTGIDDIHSVETKPVKSPDSKEDIVLPVKQSKPKTSTIEKLELQQDIDSMKLNIITTFAKREKVMLTEAEKKRYIKDVLAALPQTIMTAIDEKQKRICIIMPSCALSGRPGLNRHVIWNHISKDLFDVFNDIGLKPEVFDGTEALFIKTADAVKFANIEKLQLLV